MGLVYGYRGVVGRWFGGLSGGIAVGVEGLCYWTCLIYVVVG